MGWVIFEVLLALALAIGIVWWTMFSGRGRDGQDDDDGPAR